MIKEMLPSPAEALETAMANKNDFTPEEWTKVLESIIAAGIAVSAVDPSGLWGTLKEAAAGTPALAAAKRDPNSNELIKAAVADFERSDDGSILAMRERFAQAEPTECVQRSLASLREVSAIVDAKAPDATASGVPSSMGMPKCRRRRVSAIHASTTLPTAIRVRSWLSSIPRRRGRPRNSLLRLISRK